MPRVFTKMKNKGGKKEYVCTSCREPIVPGERYHEWSFRYGGTYRMHAKCGYPRQSQLTQARIGEVYAELEGIEDTVAEDPTGEDGSWKWTVDDIADALDNAVSVAQEIADEKREAAEEHFSGGGPLAEQADEMDEVVATIEGAASDVRDIEMPDDTVTPDEDDEEPVDGEDPWFEQVRDIVQGISI